LVSTRVVALIAAAVLWSSVGAGWVLTVSTTLPANVIDLASAVGSQYGTCQCPPSSAAPDTEALAILDPLMVGPDLLAVTVVTFAAALLLSLVSFVKWKMTLFAGILTIIAGGSWVAGLAVEKDYLYAQFNQWTAVTHDLSQPSFSPSIGPYIAMAAGVLYLGCYFLSRADVLEWPKD